MGRRKRTAQKPEDEMGKQEMIDRIADMLGKADITMVRIVYHFAVSVLRKAKR
jgi:hypothetical protein